MNRLRQKKSLRLMCRRCAASRSLPPLFPIKAVARVEVRRPALRSVGRPVCGWRDAEDAPVVE